MLCGANQLQHYSIQAMDGEIGSVWDALLDDEFWILHYLVVDTGRWLPGRKVLLRPSVLGKPNWHDHRLPVKLSRAQVKKSPDIDSDKPVSRQREIELHKYYGWPFYWGMTDVLPADLAAVDGATLGSRPRKKPANVHLRSIRELRGYHIKASDGELGHVDDFLVDDETWDVRYMVIATSNWLPGRKVLISPHWLIGDISWEEKQVTVILPRERIKHSPEYAPATVPSRHYENDLHEYYGRPGYWVREHKLGTSKSLNE